MNLRWRRSTAALAAALFAIHPLALLAQCVKQSPAHSVAVVELYTSEGCNSCPPADAWMSAIGRTGYSFDSVVPLALHVDYWDGLGWKDRFASARFTGRQNRLSDLAGSKVVYTPEVFVNTRELRGWDSAARFAQAVSAVNATPARASIRIALDPPRDGRLQVRASFRLAEGVAAPRAQAYVALYESRLRSDVKAGENRGVLLQHDHVVRQWLGPVDLVKGAADIAQTFTLDGDSLPRNMGVAALVQDESRRDVLQATALPVCAA